MNEKELIEQIQSDPTSAEKLIKQYGSQKKRSGMKSLAKMVKKMMDTQRRYFQTKSPEALNESKKLESQVYETLNKIL